MPPRGSRRRRSPSERRRRRDDPVASADPVLEPEGQVNQPDGSTDSTTVAQKIPLDVRHTDRSLTDISMRYIEARSRSKRIRRQLEISEDERGVDHLYLVLHDILDDMDIILDGQMTVCQFDEKSRKEIHALISDMEGHDAGIDLGVGKLKIRLKRAWVTLIATAALTAFLKILLSDIGGITLPFIG